MVGISPDHEVLSLALPPMPSFDLTGRRALVTGAGRGIGMASATVLAGAGAHVTLVARTLADLQAVEGSIRAAGGTAECLAADVTDTAAMRAALASRAPFDILVNSAGTNRPAGLLEVTEEDFDTVIGVNLRAAYFLTQEVVRGMVARSRGGSIVHVSSQMGHVGAARRTVYCGSKWALEGVSKAMAIELAPYGIRVNCLAPTFIETPMTSAFLADPAFRQDVLSRIKLGRLGRPADLMGAVLFLASEASSLMTGTSLVVDGGWTAE